MSIETIVSREESAAREVANLRLPVPFFDLLMVLLVTCLVFVAPLPPEDNDVQSIDISIAHGKAEQSAAALLPVIPRHTDAGWIFETSSDHQVISAEVLAQRAASEDRKVVLVVPPATALQQFVDMQAALAAVKIPFAIAIKNKETQP